MWGSKLLYFSTELDVVGMDILHYMLQHRLLHLHLFGCPLFSDLLI